MDGMEVLRAIKERWPQSEVVVAPATLIETAKEAVKLALRLPGEAGGADAVIRATTGAWMQKRWAIQRETVAN